MVILLTVKELVVLKWFVILATVGFCFFLIFKVNNIFDSKNNIKKASKDKKLKQRNDFLNNLLLSVLDKFQFVSSSINGSMTSSQEFLWRFRLSRLPIKFVSINHTVTAEEFFGFLKSLSILLFFIGISVVFLGSMSIGCIIIFFSFILPFLVGKLMDLFIHSEDDLLMVDFVNFYLAIVPQLKRGENAKLAPSVNEYYKTLLEIYPEPESHKALKKFVETFAHLLSVNPTELEAIRFLRNIYTVSDITTFCNYASQALKGENNAINLESFQHDLMNKQREALKAEGMRRAEIAQYAIYAVYIILVEVVLVCMLSKLGFNSDTFSFLKQDTGW